MNLRSTIRCPHCGYEKEETMPTDSCLFFYRCENCGAMLKPRPGDCCVFCSYGSVKCPPKQEEDGPAGGSDVRRGKGAFALAGALAAAVAASACCWLPLSLAIIGVSASGLARTFQRLRPLFLGLTVTMLVAALYLVWRDSAGESVEADECCCPDGGKGRGRRRRRIFAAAAAFIALVVSLFPWWGGALSWGNAEPPVSGRDAADMRRIVMTVEGMTCPACAARVKSRLMGLPGVARAEVERGSGRVVVYLRRGVPPDRIRNAIESVGFTVVSGVPGRVLSEPPKEGRGHE